MATAFYLLLSISVVVYSQPAGCTFLNPVRDATAETALLSYDASSSPYNFSEADILQPQCLYCASRALQVCAPDYEGVETFGIASDSVEKVFLVTNLPYIFAVGEYVDNTSTSVLVVATLRQPNLTSKYIRQFDIPLHTLRGFTRSHEHPPSAIRITQMTEQLHIER